MTAAWPSIVDAYTVVNYYNERNYAYHFCGTLHHAGAPAQVASRVAYWYRYGRRHRDDDLPAVSMATYHRLSWYIHGARGRVSDLPSVYDKGQWAWYTADRIHRDVGPAVVMIARQLYSPGCPLRLWDGITDISVVGFDWRQMIDVAPDDVGEVSVTYKWYSNDIQIDIQTYPLLVSAGGAYIAR